MERLYLAAILDLYSRRVVGWSLRDKLDTRLVESAWRMAVVNRYPPAHLLHHSDRGCQYTSEAYWSLPQAA
ncbi:MAG: DDE-type integrase/transposase/recombinase [Chloroflexi bacterium]|nr:DDE-type integrase/transposase/recombinase [Chloroflexota bacterium]